MNTSSIINSLISQNEELSRMMPMINSITIIEYDGNVIDGSIGLYGYLIDEELPITLVNRIIVCGKKNDTLQNNIQRLRSLFPSIDPETTYKDWCDTDFQALQVYDVLVFHMVGEDVSATMFDNKRGKGEKLFETVKLTRHAYYACLFIDDISWPMNGKTCLRCQLRLSDFECDDEEEAVSPTTFCRDKQNYINMCQDTLSPKDLFFQCVDEAEHGCEECNQCKKYRKQKRCPFAQRKIAEFYRQGMFVPRDEKIAHQWEVMASLQGYKSAHIQLADDYHKGAGCNQSTTKALAIYQEYARKNDGYCINRIIALADESEGRERIAAVPYIAQLAKSGDEDMILKLADAFQSQEYGLPQDIVQQKEWIKQGAENGNPRFIKAMAEMYEANSDWDGAYKWYKTLSDTCHDMVDDEKMDEIEIKMLTNGSTDEEIAIKGMNYLYGYHGTERDTHLAFRCLKYAKEKGIVLAIGLLGRMYYYGIEVAQNTESGIALLYEAAKHNDILSFETIIFEIHADDEMDAQWTERIKTAIEKGVEEEAPYALYLKGLCCLNGRIYEQSDHDASRLFNKAAEQDFPPAQYKLAVLCENGGDLSQYLHWIEIAAKNGHFEAEGAYGVELFMNRHKSTAFQYLRNACEKGVLDIEVRWCLAQCYMNGNGTPKNRSLAYPMYITAAENGYVDAQETLCKDYFHGNEFLAKSYTECARWGEIAIAKGKRQVRFETAYSLSHTGNHERAKELYLELANEGNSTAMNNYACELKNPEEKAEWFKKAADAGSDYGMWNLGRLYRDGNGVEKNIDEALRLLTKSANLGCKGAIEDLARMYRYGRDVEINGVEAVKWYQLGVDKGYNENMLELAQIYLEGSIIEKDVDLAVHYYKLAAEKGIESAILKLGNIYEDGIGVEKNTHKAIFWYRKAAANGNEEAKEHLKNLGANWVAEGKIEDENDEDN